MRLAEIRNMRTIVPAGLALALGLSLFLAGCGEENRQANLAAQWLTVYSKANPPNREWLATRVSVDDEDRVIMDVVVPDRGQVDLIKSRPRIEQALIVRMACPPKGVEIWTILSDRQVLWINLLEKTPGGLFKPITGASCKH